MLVCHFRPTGKAPSNQRSSESCNFLNSPNSRFDFCEVAEDSLVDATSSFSCSQDGMASQSAISTEAHKAIFPFIPHRHNTMVLSFKEIAAIFILETRSVRPSFVLDMEINPITFAFIARNNEYDLQTVPLSDKSYIVLPLSLSSRDSRLGVIAGEASPSSDCKCRFPA